MNRVDEVAFYVAIALTVAHCVVLWALAFHEMRRYPHDGANIMSRYFKKTLDMGARWGTLGLLAVVVVLHFALDGRYSNVGWVILLAAAAACGILGVVAAVLGRYALYVITGTKSN